MGMEIVPDKIAEEEKEKDNENNKKIKNIENQEKGNISTEIGAKINIKQITQKIGASGRRSNKIDGKLHEKSKGKWKIVKIAQLEK